MKLNRRYLLLGVIILLICGLLLLLRCCNDGTESNKPCIELEADNNAVEWEGNKNTSEPQKNGFIAIPGFEALQFKANQTSQEVNFHNPEKNNCLFLMTLFVENEEYWQSGYVEPGKGYYNIELSKLLSAGEYNAELRIQCFRKIGVELNSAKVTFDLTVLEDK